MIEIPDPRRYAADGAAGEFARIADTATLRQRLQDLLQCGDHAAIAAVMRAAPSQAVYAMLWQAICDLANHAGANDGDSGVVARVFALPLVIITGSRRPASLPGVIADVASVTQLFEQHGALGPSRNFGMGNALCSLETIESVTPGEIYAWTRDPGATRRELPPSAIVIEQPGEEVHLRFLVGAAIAPAAEPSFVETASNIGVWGMPLTRALTAQLAQPNVEVLPLARPPLDLLRAGHAGRHAQLDAAFNLFMSNAVRRLRGGTGDPDAVVSAHEDGDIRVSLSSPFDDTTIEGFRWPLHPLDDLADVLATVNEMLAACRVRNVQSVATVLPALNARGEVWFSRGDTAGKDVAGSLPH